VHDDRRQWLLQKHEKASTGHFLKITVFFSRFFLSQKPYILYFSLAQTQDGVCD